MYHLLLGLLVYPDYILGVTLQEILIEEVPLLS